VRAFRLFWSGFTFSVLGDAMSRVALTWFVYESTRSAEALGWLMLAYTGPVIAGGLVAGSLLDRFDRRKVMLVDNLVRGLAVASVPLLHGLGLLQLWHIYVVAAIYGSLMMVSLAGGPALIPSLVRKEHLPTANALEMLTFTLGGVMGPMLAGLLISSIGAPNVLVFDALSYGVFALALARIRLPDGTAEAVEVSNAQVGRSKQSLWDVTRFAVGSRVLLSTTIMFAAFNLGQGFLFVWLPVLSDQMPGGGPELYGILLGVWAVGEVVGSILAGSVTLSLPLGTLICGSQLLSGLSLGAMVLDQSLWYVAPALVLLGLFSAPLTIWAQTLRMQVIPANMRGRTFALLRTLMQSTPPIGGAIAGLLLPVLGIPAMIAASAALAGVPGLLGYGVSELRSAGDSGPNETAGVPVPGDIDYAIGE
ncbi:MAG TPA: MFS transporter, partial [Chloroflexia bacterium]